MPKSANQKMKLLYIIKYLEENSDENHPVCTQDLIKMLDQEEIKAERKSIYDDIRCLTEFGYDIEQKKGRGETGYYLASRDFELPELKLLVDAVAASRFITEKKSRELVKKLESKAGKHQASQLQRQVIVAGRVKADNESIYYLIDSIYSAIDGNKQISFVYRQWNSDKKLEAKNNGEAYIVSPWALIWDDENYYLAAYDEKAGIIKHYRVDKMASVKVLEEKRLGREEFDKIDMGQYTRKNFGMFKGIDEMVTLRCHPDKIGIILDRFGKEIDIRKKSPDCVTARVPVFVSRQFYGWVAGLGGDISITAPEAVKNEYETYLRTLLEEQLK